MGHRVLKGFPDDPGGISQVKRIKTGYSGKFEWIEYESILRYLTFFKNFLPSKTDFWSEKVPKMKKNL